MILPAVTQALQDHQLRPTDYRVYGYCLEYLDLVTFRALKAKPCSRVIGKHRSQVTRSLLRLTKLGYLEAGAKLDGHTRTYRLCLSVTKSAHNKAA